ncbi:MAG: acetyl-coenzyme A synthetase N-terminal domain-containing protein, partial [Actinomycetota bacterium]
MVGEVHAIDALAFEQRKFPPSPEFKAHAIVHDQSLYEEGRRDFVSYWSRHARELISWAKPFSKTLEWDLPYAEWFSDGMLNVSYN